MQKAGVVPRERFDLSAIETIMPAGSPVSPAITAWFYENVKRDLWVATGSGGTDICTGLVGGVPTLPVRAGEIQARSLGVAAQAWDDAGHPVVGQVGELVITAPMPSMPVFFWGDERRRPLPGELLRDLPRRLAARRLLRGQRPRRLLRPRPLRRRPQPAGRADRDGRDLPRGRGRPRRAHVPGGQPRPARRRLLHAAVRRAAARRRTRRRDRHPAAPRAPRGVHAPPRARPDHRRRGHPAHPQRQEDGDPGPPRPARRGPGRGRRPERDGRPGLLRRHRRATPARSPTTPSDPPPHR